MATFPRVSPVRGNRKIHRVRWLVLVALCAVSMTSLALSDIGAPLAKRWLYRPVARLLATDFATLDRARGDADTIRAMSAFERIRNAVLSAVRRDHARREQAVRPWIGDDRDTLLATGPMTSAPGRGTPPVGTAPGTGRSQLASLVTLRPDLSYVDLDSPAYRRFKSWVDEGVAGNPGYLFSASDAALMYAITKQQKYCTTAVEMAEDQVATAESRIAGGSAPEVARDSYYSAGRLISDLSMTYKICGDMLSASQHSRWSAYAEQAVWNIWNHDGAKWGGKSMPWSGWAVDNPGNNYYYNFVEATMFWALASGNRGWINMLRQDKLPALRTYFAKMPGGGSNEGTGYGTAHMNLFTDYMVWRHNTGVDLANANSHVTNSIRYWVHATVPTLDRFAPIGDQARSSIPNLYDYHRRLVLEARHLSYDEDARNMASWWLNNISVSEMTSGFNYRYDMLPAGNYNSPPSELVYFAEGTGDLFARTGWDKAAMWVAFIAGPYNESHAAQEQGGFTLFSGDWLAVTENNWTHSGIQQGVPQHNVVRFERNGQVLEQDYRSVADMTVSPGGSGGAFTATSDLTQVYARNAASVGNWTRRLDFGGRKLTVTDNFSLGSSTTATFQINVPVQPQVSGNTITAGKLRVRVLSPANPTIRLLDWRSVDSSEYNSGWRIDISGSSTGYKVELTDH